MFIPKGFDVKSNIRISQEDELMSYMEQEYVSVPARYPCISVPLESTTGLIILADQVRAANGKVPLWDKSLTGTIDDEGWYRFSIDLQRNPLDHRMLFPRVYFYAEFCNSDDNEMLYMIDIPDSMYDEFDMCIGLQLIGVDLGKMFDDEVKRDQLMWEMRKVARF